MRLSNGPLSPLRWNDIFLGSKCALVGFPKERMHHLSPVTILSSGSHKARTVEIAPSPSKFYPRVAHKRRALLELSLLYINVAFGRLTTSMLRRWNGASQTVGMTPSSSKF